jgi:DNA-binding NarL/FixJ family response regulator
VEALMPSIRIVIMCAGALTRVGLQQILARAAPRMEVVGVCSTFAEAEACLRQQHARVLIADDSQPSVNLAKELRRLMHAQPGLVCIVILQRPVASALVRLLRIGVRALLHREDDLEDSLSQAVLMAAAGSTSISPRFTPYLERAASLPASLSQRDLDVLQLLTEGMEPKEIAVALGVKYNVVNRALKRMQRTYDAQNLPQLVVLALEVLSKRDRHD